MAAIADSTPFKATGHRRDLVHRLGLSGFRDWWARELATLMPAGIRSALEHRRARPVLAFDGGRATLLRPVRANGQVKMVEVAQISLHPDAQVAAAAGRNAFAALLRAGNSVAPEIVVAISPRAALRKTLTLPAAIEGNLHQALAYDLDRHTPFKADELYFDAVVVDRDAARNTLQVELASARRATVDPMLRHAESFGARVIAVSVDPPAAAAVSRLNLLPEDRRVAGTAWTRWQVVVPAILLVAGIVAALALPVWQKREEAIALNTLSDEARQRASVSDALRTELERKVGDYNFALERKYAFPGAIQVLDDITRLLPDDTWLTQLELRGTRGKDGQRELALRGESANAGRLVSLLEESKLFTLAAPRSPTTKIQPGPGEIFDVGAQLKPLTAPPAAPLDVTARPAPVTPAPVRAPAAAQAPTTPTAAAPSTPASSAAAAPTTPSIPGAAAPSPAGASTPSAAVPPPPAATGTAAPAQAVPSGPRAPARNALPPGATPRSGPPMAPGANPGAPGPAEPALAPPPGALEVPAPESEPPDGDGNPQ